VPTRLAILQTARGVEQIQVGFIRPPHCPAGGLCLWPGNLGSVCQPGDAQCKIASPGDAQAGGGLLSESGQGSDGDETFPRILDWQSLRAKGHSLGVAICENGLIRGGKVLRHPARDLGALFKGVVGKGYQPHYFLSDFDVHFPKVVSQAIADIRFLKDFVHAPRDHWALR